jgi:hypothetical protein
VTRWGEDRVRQTTLPDDSDAVFGYDDCSNITTIRNRRGRPVPTFIGMRDAECRPPGPRSMEPALSVAERVAQYGLFAESVQSVKSVVKSLVE